MERHAKRDEKMAVEHGEEGKTVGGKTVGGYARKSRYMALSGLEMRLKSVRENEWIRLINNVNQINGQPNKWVDYKWVE